MRTWIWLFSGFLAVSAARADSGDFLTAVRADTVFLFIRETPPVGVVCHVERKGPGDRAFVRMTQNPLRPAVSGAQVSAILGDHYSTIQAQLETVSPEQMLLRLRFDTFTSMIYSMLYHPVGTLLGRFFKMPGHEPGNQYVYRVLWMNRDGEVIRARESEVRIKENPPDPPDNLRVRLTERGVAVEWDYPRWRPGRGDLTVQFVLTRKTSAGIWERIHDRILLRMDGLAYFYADPLAERGETYIYAMKAVDALGLESERVEAGPLTVRDITPPSAPAGLTAESGPGGIRLIWNQNPELDVIAYHVYRWEGISEDSVRINADPVSWEDPFFIDEGAVTGVQYYYGVSAVDREGNESVRSNRIAVFPTDRTPPGKPMNLSAGLEDGMVVLTWAPPADTDLWGFRVSRGFDEANQYILSEKAGLNTNYSDRGTDKTPLRPGGRYFYTVKALDTLRRAGEPAGVWITLPDREAPDQPGGILADIEGEAVRIRWNPSPSLDAAGYRVIRHKGEIAEELKMEEPGRTVLFDRAVQKGFTYRYSVTARDTAGNESAPVTSAPLFMRDFDPPPRPRFTAARLTEQGVRIYWELVVDFDLAGYHVYRSVQATGIFERITVFPVTDLEFVDFSGTPDHWYRVRAVDTSNNESEALEAVKAVRGPQ
ncbi:MAG TPA: hypothetical protein ENN03_10600 [bacterium]|nr:hypothetical protein [bacterium]